MLARATLRLRGNPRLCAILSSQSSRRDIPELNAASGKQVSRAFSNRPISPHVNIYKFPVAALSSITNRVTGCLLSVGCFGVGGAAMFLDCNIPALLEPMKEMGALMPIVKLSVAFPLVYHYLGGVRHLIWDHTLKGLDIKSMEQSSYILFGSSAVISLGLAFISF
mmetsp:Transcript_32212/g.56549  ORF Transcript_32212/g.56549 Transcript_32212/m.56549 type:complete len:166 (+) Transcript_32212:68-565(+)